jgi:hypothetical protein
MDKHPEEIMLELLQRQTEAIESINQILEALLKGGQVDVIPIGQTSITKAWE